MQDILSKVFELIFSLSDVDLKERAAYYYNLLKIDIEEAEFIILGEGRAQVDAFLDGDSSNFSKVFREFNTLSVLYGRPSEKFIKKYVEEGDLKKEIEIVEPVVIIKEVENKPQSEYKIIDYEKASFDGKAVINQIEYDGFWESYGLESTKSFDNIPEEIDIKEFIEYLSSENHVFCRGYIEQSKIVNMSLYSLDTANNTYILCYLTMDFNLSKLTMTVRHCDTMIIEYYMNFLFKVFEPLISN